MINQKKFALLGIKQKIYKIAASIRNLEIKLKNGIAINAEELLYYTAYIHEQKGRKIEAVQKILKNLDVLPSLPHKEKLKLLNFSYHDLLKILDQFSDEDKKFSFVQFDNLEKSVFRYPWIAILDNLRSPMNVGSIMRSCDGFGTGKLFLCGITPSPPNKKLSRTALGSEEFIEYQYFEKTEDAILNARNSGYTIFGLEVVAEAQKLSEIDHFEKIAFVFGNEEFGITETILALCDGVVYLPQVGKKNSINVSNVFSIVAYQIANYYLTRN